MKFSHVPILRSTPVGWVLVWFELSRGGESSTSSLGYHSDTKAVHGFRLEFLHGDGRWDYKPLPAPTPPSPLPESQPHPPTQLKGLGLGKDIYVVSLPVVELDERGVMIVSLICG